MLMDLSCRGFIEEVDSPAPAPGGGSVAALAGALGAALVGMVGRLTLGKEKFALQEEAMTEAIAQAVKLKEELKKCVDADCRAFTKVVEAYRLPKGTEEERKQRAAVIQRAMEEAARLPMTVAENSLAVLKLAGVIVEEGNPHALSDGGVAALVAYAGIQGAIYNVEINLLSIKDAAFKSKLEEKKQKILKEAEINYILIRKRVSEKLCTL
ncbi:MAG: cyclodeaminase/cyclohydrolase family protein [Peptococcaceae bacterium]